MEYVGLVVVSHSRVLADAAVALAAEMLPGRTVPIAVAAGLDGSTFGTDAVQIRDAIIEVDSPQGVVVLMDMGSAVLSAELALDLLEDPQIRDRVTLSAAPLIEGLVVASVASAGGADRAQVAAEADDALLGKRSQLSIPGDVEDTASGNTATLDDLAPEAGEAAVITVTNEHGLHARPAARLVNELRGLTATVTLRNGTTGTGPVPATSLTRVATLGVLAGHELEIQASGPQAREAVDRLIALAADRFGEPEAGTVASPPGTGVVPRAASPGIAVGPLRVLVVDPLPEVESRHDRADGPSDPAEEWPRVESAITEVRRQIEAQRDSAAQSIGPDEAGIFDAHLALLADQELLADARSRISATTSGPSAWDKAVSEIERQWAALPDEYLQARAADVRAVGDQVRRVMTGLAPPHPSGVGILVAQDLTPADVADLDLDLVTGIALADGSPTSHAAILARARGIPAVVGVGRDILAVAEGTPIAVDGSSGEVYLKPTEQELAHLSEQTAVEKASAEADLAAASSPSVTADGVRVQVLANLGSAAEAEAAANAGADGSGLVRTEFLFLDSAHAPSIDEQESAYAAIVEAFPGRRVTFRTLDVGGDKPLTYLPQAAEANPYLGLRGLRLSLAKPGLLRDQLVALCRVARSAPIDVMFPMVSVRREVDQALALLDEVTDGKRPAGLRVGVMVEVPAAALKIATLLPALDFVSIGTNDLVQYTLAAERGNAQVADLSDPLDPAVLQLIAHVCAAASEAGVSVSVCGEAAADQDAVPLLFGLGVRSVSVAGPAVPRTKALIRHLDLTLCAQRAEDALLLADAAAVRSIVRRSGFSAET